MNTNFFFPPIISNLFPDQLIPKLSRNGIAGFVLYMSFPNIYYNLLAFLLSQLLQMSGGLVRNWKEQLWLICETSPHQNCTLLSHNNPSFLLLLVFCMTAL